MILIIELINLFGLILLYYINKIKIKVMENTTYANYKNRFLILKYFIISISMLLIYYLVTINYSKVIIDYISLFIFIIILIYFIYKAFYNKFYYISILKEYIIVRDIYSEKKIFYKDIISFDIDKKYIYLKDQSKSMKVYRVSEYINIISDYIYSYNTNQFLREKVFLMLYKSKFLIYNEDDFRTISFDFKVNELLKFKKYNNELIISSRLPDNKMELYNKDSILFKYDNVLRLFQNHYYNNDFVVFGSISDYYLRKYQIYIYYNDFNKLNIVFNLLKKFKIDFEIDLNNKINNYNSYLSLKPDSFQFEKMVSFSLISKYIKEGFHYNNNYKAYIKIFFKDIKSFDNSKDELNKFGLFFINGNVYSQSDYLLWEDIYYLYEANFELEIKLNYNEINKLIKDILNIIKNNAQFGFWTLYLNDLEKKINFKQYRSL